MLQATESGKPGLSPRTPRLRALAPLLCLALAAGCGEPPAATATPPYDLVMNTHQLMVWVLEPAADVVWDSAGTIITAGGREELAPVTDEGWERVERAGALLGESGNLLMLPGRSPGDDWLEYSRALGATGRLVIEAARAQDADALFDAGGRVYQVCRACHNQYWVKEDG